MVISEYIIISIIIILLIFSFMGEVTYYVKSTGEIRPNEKSSTIKNLLTGKLIEINISDGILVKKGDVLFKTDTSTTYQTLAALIYEQSCCNLEVAALNILWQSIISNNNLFNPCNSNETEYSIKYEEYADEIMSSIQKYKNNKLDINKLRGDASIIYQKATELLEKLRFDLDQIDYLIESIRSGACTFPNMNAESVYPKRYQDYITDVEKYIQAVKIMTDVKDSIGKRYIIGEIKKAKYLKSQENLKAYQAEFENYKYDYLILAQQTREILKSFIIDINLSAKNIENFIDIDFEKIIMERIKLEALLFTCNEILIQRQNLFLLNKDMKRLNFNLLGEEVISPIDGQINMCSEIKQNDYLQSGIDMANIIPKCKSKYRVLIYICSSEICKIRVNQKIKLCLPSSPICRCNELYGTLINICNETKTDSTSGYLYYIAECTLSPESTKIFDNVFNSTFNVIDCSAKVIYKQCKIFNWLLEKLYLAIH